MAVTSCGISLLTFMPSRKLFQPICYKYLYLVIAVHCWTDQPIQTKERDDIP